MTIRGTILSIGDLQEFNDGSFQKKEIVLRIDETSQYPQEIPIEIVQKSLVMLDQVKVGDEIDLDVNLRGSIYNDKRYSNIQGWRLSVINKGAQVAQEPQEIVADNQKSNGLPF